MKKLLKHMIIRWLEERALRLPTSVRQKIADKLRIDVGIVFAIEETYREHIISEIEKW